MEHNNGLTFAIVGSAESSYHIYHILDNIHDQSFNKLSNSFKAVREAEKDHSVIYAYVYDWIIDDCYDQFGIRYIMPQGLMPDWFSNARIAIEQIIKKIAQSRYAVFLDRSALIMSVNSDCTLILSLLESAKVDTEFNTTAYLKGMLAQYDYPDQNLNMLHKRLPPSMLFKCSFYSDHS